MTEQKRTEIEHVIVRYFDASYEGSGETMKQVFHPAAHVYGLRENGELIDWPLEEFARLVDGDEAPAKTGQAREDELLSMTFTGEREVAVAVRLRIGNTRYTDILCLMEFDGQWRIIAKMLAACVVETE